MLDQNLDANRPMAVQPSPATGVDHSTDEQPDDELGEEDVPTVVLYVIAALLLLSFSLYLILGGGHSHFH